MSMPSLSRVILLFATSVSMSLPAPQCPHLRAVWIPNRRTEFGQQPCFGSIQLAGGLPALLATPCPRTLVIELPHHGLEPTTDATDAVLDRLTPVLVFLPHCRPMPLGLCVPPICESGKPAVARKQASYRTVPCR
jgi:hypothetical protein